MIRLFPEHRIRRTVSLDGVWRLETADGREGRRFSALVPGVWENIPQLARYRGECIYRREFRTEQTANLLFRFSGVSHTASVYLDGREIGRHYDAFTGFRMAVPEVAAGQHEIRVVVDNRFSEASTLHIPNDYYSYGGITRPVEMEEIPDAYIDCMHFVPVPEEGGKWHAEVTVRIRAVRDSAGGTVRVSVAGGTAEADLAPLSAGGERTVRVRVRCGEIVPWELLNPHLYDLEAVLQCGEERDDLMDRVGFRTVGTEKEKLLLNGKKIRIRGINRHEEYGSQGNAVSPGSMMEDLQLMLDLGVNSVRTSHYPNDPRFLDLCDELGILVWEECHSRAIPGEIMRKPLFMEQITANAREMVEQHYNHPCIYTWGLLNECESETEFGRGVYSRVIDLIRSLDAGRPVTYASCRFFTDICLDLADIASFNLYPLWYNDSEPAAYGKELLKWMDENGAGDKPIIFSEFGAGAVAGFHDPLNREKWSEERQADILDRQLNAFLAEERVCGTYIWQFADVRVAEEWFMNRPLTQNNKGITDRFRRPKMAYDTVRKHYLGKD